MLLKAVKSHVCAPQGRVCLVDLWFSEAYGILAGTLNNQVGKRVVGPHRESTKSHLEIDRRCSQRNLCVRMKMRTTSGRNWRPERPKTKDPLQHALLDDVVGLLCHSAGI
eukprot:4511691-Amphidinium_carterae.1